MLSQKYNLNLTRHIGLPGFAAVDRYSHDDDGGCEAVGQRELCIVQERQGGYG